MKFGNDNFDLIDKLNSRFNNKCSKILLIIIFVFLSIFSLSAPVHRMGDSSTYYMQIQSIAQDLNIQYEEIDISRVMENRFDDLPAGLILIKNEAGRYYYGKEFSYALFAAPFYKIFGNKGILFFNGILLCLMILMAYIFLTRDNNELIASSVSILFFILSTTFIYLIWIHAEIYNMFVLMLGLFLWIHYRKNGDIKYLGFSTLVFAIATVAKVPNILIYIPFLIFEMYEKRWKNIIVMLVLFTIPVAIFYGYFYINTGAISFYGGDRLYYVGNFPFIDGYNDINEAGEKAFSIDENRISGMINTDNLKIVLYNMYYYVFGRSTGVLWYYPLAIFALISFIISFRKGKKNEKLPPEKYLILSGIILYILFFIIIIGNNYLGGQHAVGNRYFYVYPAFLFLLSKIDIKDLAVFILVSLVFVAPVISDPSGNTMHPEEYLFSPPYIFIPFEYGQLGNLPIWTHHHKIDGFDIYRLDENSKYFKGIIIIKNSSEILIRSNKRIKDLNVLLYSPSENNLIKVSSKKSIAVLKINQKEDRSLTIFDIEPEYYDNRGSIYKLHVSTSGSIFFSPIEKETRFK